MSRFDVENRRLGAGGSGRDAEPAVAERAPVAFKKRGVDKRVDGGKGVITREGMVLDQAKLRGPGFRNHPERTSAKRADNVFEARGGERA